VPSFDPHNPTCLQLLSWISLKKLGLEFCRIVVSLVEQVIGLLEVGDTNEAIWDITSYA
jgi:hypothetical protein